MMLWFMVDPKGTYEKEIEVSSKRYLEKYGIAPTLCHVPLPVFEKMKEQQEGDITVNGIKIIGLKNILKRHLEIGVPPNGKNA